MGNNSSANATPPRFSLKEKLKLSSQQENILRRYPWERTYLEPLATKKLHFFLNRHNIVKVKFRKICPVIDERTELRDVLPTDTWSQDGDELSPPSTDQLAMMRLGKRFGPCLENLILKSSEDVGTRELRFTTQELLQTFTNLAASPDNISVLPQRKANILKIC